MTTRAVAERAGLPHGAVSYHFRGQQGLLIEAAMYAFARAIPAEEFAALTGVEDLIGLIAAEVGDREAIDPVLSRLMFASSRGHLRRARYDAVHLGNPRSRRTAFAADVTEFRCSGEKPRARSG